MASVADDPPPRTCAQQRCGENCTEKGGQCNASSHEAIPDSAIWLKSDLAETTCGSGPSAGTPDAFWQTTVAVCGCFEVLLHESEMHAAHGAANGGEANGGEANGGEANPRRRRATPARLTAVTPQNPSDPVTQCTFSRFLR